jgi:hypothetical protein
MGGFQTIGQFCKVQFCIVIIVVHIGHVKPLSNVSTTAFMDDIEREMMRQIEEAEDEEDEDTSL